MKHKRNYNKARLGHTCAKGLYLFLLAALMAGLVLSGGPGSVPVAYAAGFLVNNYGDDVDCNPGDGICETVPFNGQCTLRAAIMEANVWPGSDAIDLPPGTYLLTRAGAGEDQADTGDLDITDGLTITGAGAAATIVDGVTLDRVFDILLGATLNISGVTIQNGDTTGDITVVGGGIKGIGGGIRNQGALTLTNVNVQNNTATFDAGGGIANQGTLVVIGGTMSGNSARDAGGGIFNLGTATLNNVTVSDNTVERRGGGIATLGSLTLTGSTVSGNTANRQGGGIFSEGILVINTSTINDNTINVPGSFGGGIYNVGLLTMDQSTIRDNTARKGGGGLLHSSTANATLTDSTISGNIVSLQGMGGGGIYNRGPMSLTNVTISGNEASAGYGAAIRNNAGSNLEVTFTTIYTNTGINSIHNLGTATFKNTIVAGGTGVSEKVVVTSEGYNLESANSCGFTKPGDLINITDPRLGSLADNGGPTLTHGLYSDSPALDQIPAGTNGCGTTVTNDQRGVVRPKNLLCDIGAFEDPITAVLETGCYDFDGDGEVGVADIMLVASRWNSSVGDDNYEPHFDVDEDGRITVVDIMQVAAQWGQLCP